MKAVRNEELSDIASRLQALVGAQLQEASQTETEFGLGFYNDRRMVWLWFDMDARRPVVLYFDNKPPVKSKITKPLLLFVRKHFIGKRLQEVVMNVELGRVLEFAFHDPTGDEKRLEARLFPHGQNLMVYAEKKSVSLLKPKDTPSKPQVRSETAETSPSTVRSWETITEEWMKEKGLLKNEASRGQPAVTDAERAQKAWEKAVQKKTQALEKMHEDIRKKSDPGWREAGDWLKTNGTVEVPPEHRDRVDQTRSLAWNIETCFSKAKENERKLSGTRERLAMLERELHEIRAKGPEGYAREAQRKAALASSGHAKSAASLLEQAGARGRRFVLGKENDLEAYIGKSAADNLALLRRSQPHDLWMHLRDYPGSHAILRRPKGRPVTDEELNEVGRWVVQQSLHKSESELKGGRYDMILAECRHVRPIKGDKLGRVNYQNDRLVVIRL